MTWHDLYRGDVQSLYAPIAVAVLFLLYRLVAGRPAGGVLAPAAGFVDGYAIAVAVETVLDVIATGPLARGLGLADGPGGTAIMLTFVLVGDLRVYLLLFGLLAIAAGLPWHAALGRAGAWTLLVPAIAYPTNTLLHAWIDGLDPNSLWLIYETTFALVALALRARLLGPASGIDPKLRAYLRAALLYVAVYYGLWATADVLIQFAGLDIGWALRIVPNQLYYAWWAPFVWWRFFRKTD